MNNSLTKDIIKISNRNQKKGEKMKIGEEGKSLLPGLNNCLHFCHIYLRFLFFKEKES